jgi:uncharacterized protein YeeX (DUF496 family)
MCKTLNQPKVLFFVKLDDYIDRSRELLLKLNELADDKREFSFIFKAFNDKKKLNVFSSL